MVYRRQIIGILNFFRTLSNIQNVCSSKEKAHYERLRKRALKQFFLLNKKIIFLQMWIKNKSLSITFEFTLKGLEVLIQK